MLTDLPWIRLFSQAYQVRVLDSSKYEATQRLQHDCTTLTSKIEQLNGLVRTYLEVLDKQAGLQYARKRFAGPNHVHHDAVVMFIG